jgi:hypothetical protein
MSSDNQNFIIGLVSAIALVAGLIYTFISIHKANLEIRKLHLKSQKHNNASKNKSISHFHSDFRKFPINFEVVIDALFFLLFSIGSINAIVEYLANEVPVFALVIAQVFVLIYSYILLIDNPRLISQHISQREQRYFRLVGRFGLFISLALTVLIGIQRLAPLFFSPSPYDSTIAKIFSLVVNLAIAPLLVFSLVSLHRIIRYVSNVVISQ